MGRVLQDVIPARSRRSAFDSSDSADVCIRAGEPKPTRVEVWIDRSDRSVAGRSHRFPVNVR